MFLWWIETKPSFSNNSYKVTIYHYKLTEDIFHKDVSQCYYFDGYATPASVNNS